MKTRVIAVFGLLVMAASLSACVVDPGVRGRVVVDDGGGWHNRHCWRCW